SSSPPGVDHAMASSTGVSRSSSRLKRDALMGDHLTKRLPVTNEKRDAKAAQCCLLCSAPSETLGSSVAATRGHANRRGCPVCCPVPGAWWTRLRSLGAGAKKTPPELYRRGGV